MREVSPALSFHIDEVQGIVVVEVFELSDPRAVLRDVKSLRSDPRFHPTFDIVIDCSRLARVPDRTLVRRYARLGRHASGRRGRVAICASAAGVYRMARVFEMLSGATNNLCAFRNTQQAAAWLCA
jgi:hypothetical protein